RRKLIAEHDLIISMLPAFMHFEAARECVEFKKHMLTASYVSDQMQELHQIAQKSGVILLHEIGLDPGIDHMTAMQTIDRLLDEGKVITEFESFTGGLLAPESEDNPWKYKFAWNPRNVVIAGSGGAVKYLRGGKYYYIPPHRVFETAKNISIPKLG